MTLIPTELYLKLFADAHRWHALQYERVPPQVLLGVLLALAIGAVVILALEIRHLTAWCRQVDEINRELHRKVDDLRDSFESVSSVNTDLQVGFQQLKLENDRLQGEVLR